MEKCNALLILENNTDVYETAINYSLAISNNLCILVVLEDIYMLEKASTSLGLPSSPELVPKAKEKIKKKLDIVKSKLKSDLILEEIVVDKLEKAVPELVDKIDPKVVIFALSDLYKSAKLAHQLEKNSLIIKLRGG